MNKVARGEFGNGVAKDRRADEIAKGMMLNLYVGKPFNKALPFN